MNNGCFIYEDTFVHLLNLVFYLIQNHLKPENIKNTMYTPNLLDHVIVLKIEKNPEIISKIIASMGSFTFRSIYYVFLSDVDNKELIIYY